MLAEKETKRILGVAFEFVCAGLRTGDCDDDVKEAIAKKIIQLANSREFSRFGTLAGRRCPHVHLRASIYVLALMPRDRAAGARAFSGSEREGPV